MTLGEDNNTCIQLLYEANGAQACFPRGIVFGQDQGRYWEGFCRRVHVDSAQQASRIDCDRMIDTPGGVEKVLGTVVRGFFAFSGATLRTERRLKTEPLRHAFYPHITAAGLTSVCRATQYLQLALALSAVQSP